LDDFFEFDTAEMLSRHFAGKMHRIGMLPDRMIVELLECAITSEDISTAQALILKNTLKRLTTTPPATEASKES
jgi:hypothetical protein